MTPPSSTDNNKPCHDDDANPNVMHHRQLFCLENHGDGEEEGQEKTATEAYTGRRTMLHTTLTMPIHTMPEA